MDKQCKSAKEFIDFFLAELLFKPQHIFDANRPGLNGYIFRGQACSLPLLASAFRPGDPLKVYTPQTPGKNKCSEIDKRQWDLGWQLKAELRAVFLFLEEADKQGIVTPLEYINTREHQDLIKNALNREKDADYDSPFPAPHLLTNLALAQHHGVPTRLIDWSESPFIAAFFAALAYGATESVCLDEKDLISVFFLNTDPIRNGHAGISLVSAPRRNNTFLHVQKGLFTYIPNANAFFLHEGRWPTLEDITESCGELKGALGRFQLPASQAKELLKLLYLLGITKSSLMPSLDNAANAFQYRKTIFS